MTNIFIFNNGSRAAGYGVGTYVQQLSSGLLSMEGTKVSIVEMYADVKEYEVTERTDGSCLYQIPPMQSGMESEAYCRVVFYCLARSINVGEGERMVFQFNFFQHYPLALLLKSHYPCCEIVLAVHYMNWCFELKGNVSQLRKLTDGGHEPAGDAERRVLSSVDSERVFLHLADMVWVLSNYTMNILREVYSVSEDKMLLVYNGLGEEIPVENRSDKSGYRHILFVGRLDEIKGLRYLIDAFEMVASKHADAQLTIIGDGDFHPYMVQSRKLRGRVAFLGKMDNASLEEVYGSAYIGVMPSFHEQCSYTAIEMMRHGIPVIGTDSTGMKEMLDATPYLCVHIDETDFSEKDFVCHIAELLDELLSDAEMYEKSSDAVRRQFQMRYTVNSMMRGVEGSIKRAFAEGTHVSRDYYHHIDNRMASLIKDRPEMDNDMYGLAGIGVYLWWRIIQMRKDDCMSGDTSAALEKNLADYLEWIGEADVEEAFPAELYAVLVEMRNREFCVSMVKSILKGHEFAAESIAPCGEPEILHNALRLCSCKI